MERDFAKELEKFPAVWERVCGGAKKQAEASMQKQSRKLPQKTPEAPGLMPRRGSKGPDSPFRPKGR